MANKARAYLRQARADYDAYVASGDNAAPLIREHHRLQLIQMAVEKFAKAFLYHSEPNARYSHHVVQYAMARIRGSHEIARAVGMKPAAFSRTVDAATPILLQIEATSPSVGLDGRRLTREESERTANAEYPWQNDVNDAASWVAPASHVFGITRQLRYDRRSYAAVRLLDRLIDAADVVLPLP